MNPNKENLGPNDQGSGASDQDSGPSDQNSNTQNLASNIRNIPGWLMNMPGWIKALLAAVATVVALAFGFVSCVNDASQLIEKAVKTDAPSGGVLPPQPLEASTSGASTIEENSIPSYSSYTTITDDTGALSVEVPTDWGEVNGGLWGAIFLDGEKVGAGLKASTNVYRHAQFEVPGVFIGASHVLRERSYNVTDLLNNLSLQGKCSYENRYNYDDGTYTGKQDIWKNCAQTGAEYWVIAATPDSGTYLMEAEFQILSEADREAADHILQTLQVEEDKLPI